MLLDKNVDLRERMNNAAADTNEVKNQTNLI